MRSVIQSCGFEFPSRRITLNLAPADLPKDGGHFDLAIALGLLGANCKLPAVNMTGIEFRGEAALSGVFWISRKDDERRVDLGAMEVGG